MLLSTSAGNVEDGRNVIRCAGVVFSIAGTQITVQQGNRNQVMRKVRAAFQESENKQMSASVVQKPVSADLSAVRANLRPMALYDHL